MSCELQNVYDICILQNQTFELPLILYDDDGISPLNISAWSFTGSIKHQYSDVVPVLFFTSSIIDPVSGSLKLYMGAEQTWALTNKKYVYDLISNNPSGSIVNSVTQIETLRLMQGKVSVTLGVTEP